MLPDRNPAPADLEQRAAKRRVPDLPLASGGAHDRVGDSEPETSTAALFRRAVETVEQPVAVLGKDA
jgi:hypothetical protein